VSQPAQKMFEARLPFSFAKRHGILVTGQSDDSLEVVCLPSIQPQVLLEAQRYFSAPLKLREVGNAEFDQLLQQAYEDRSSQTIE
jgi:general secretion pathway protein E